MPTAPASATLPTLARRASYFRTHMLQPVRFSDEIEQIYQAGGRVFVECGPRDVLTRLVDTILGERPHIAVALNPQREGDGDRQLRQALAQLMVAGLALRPGDAYALPESRQARQLGGRGCASAATTMSPRRPRPRSSRRSIDRIRWRWPRQPAHPTTDDRRPTTDSLAQRSKNRNNHVRR